MHNRRLILLCGISASGKSSWAKEAADYEYDIIVSRDEIRFELLKDSTDYFSKEKEVFDKFINDINSAGANSRCYEVYADATHISPQSRAKVLSRIDWNLFSELQVEVFDCPLEVALKRNSTRSGLARVPDSAIENMYKNFKLPALDEFVKYNRDVSINYNRYKGE